MIRTIITLLICTIVFACVQDGYTSNMHDVFFRASLTAKKTFNKLPKPSLKIAESEPTLIALKTIYSYQDMFKLYTEIIQERILNSQTTVPSIHDLEQFQDVPRVLANIYKDTMSIGVKLINEYNDLISSSETDYLKTALYYRVLQWIQTQTVYSKPIVDAIQKIIESQEARNYLAEIFEPSKQAKWIDSEDLTLKTIQGWTQRNKYDDAIFFMKQIANARGDNAKDVSMDCTDIEVYEDILENANSDYFEMIFGKTPGNMMLIVDYAFDTKVLAGQIHAESPCTEATPTKNIDLSKLPSAMVRYKHASILFVRAFETKFDLNPLTKGMQIDLRRQSVRDSPLRYNVFQTYMSNLPIAMTDVLDLLKPLRLFSQKSYLYRLLKWYKTNMYHLDGSSKDINEELFKLQNTSHAKYLLTDFISMDYQYNEIEGNAVRINTFVGLLQFGKRFDSDLSYIMKVTFDELQEERKEIDAKIDQFEDAKKSSKEYKELIKKSTQIREAIRNVLSYGMPTMRTPNISLENCENILNEMNNANFQTKFLKSTTYIKEKISSILRITIHSITTPS